MPDKKGLYSLLIPVLVIAVLFALWLLLPVGQWLDDFNQWLTANRWLGAGALALLYVVGTVFMFPGSPLTLAAGLAFGLWGFLIVIPAATIGAMGAFLVARHFLRSAVLDRFGSGKKFSAVDRAISEKGWQIVFLLRLSPLFPFNVQNYLYGVTGIGFVPCLAATFFGIMPGTLLYVYLGAAGRLALEEGGEASVWRWVLFAAGLVATLIVTVLVTKRAKAALSEAGLGGS